MQIVSWLLVTSSLAAPAAPATNAPATQPEVSAPAISFAAPQQRPTMAPLPSASTPARSIGLGGGLSVSNYGISGSTRYFFNKHVGFAISGGWYRPRTYATYYTPNSAIEARTSSTVMASPSMIISFNETDPNREVSVRPYVGIGAGYIRASRPSGLRAPGYSYSATSQHASFGSEIFFRDHPNFALTAEAIYYNIPNDFMNRMYVDGLNFQVGATFYLR
jgi:hypothetical protein